MSKSREEKLVNRILINYGIAAIAYIVLYVLMNRYYMKYSVVLPLAGVSFVLSVVCYLLDKFTNLNSKNYGHMFLAFSLALLVTQSAFVTSNLFGINFFSKISNNVLMSKVFNSSTSAKGFAWLGALYLICMTVYNSNEIVKAQKNSVNDKVKKIHRKKK